MIRLLVLAVLGATAQEAAPYSFTAPEGWRKERMEFPLGFAKDLEYKGHEDLRFAPGMFKPEEPDYFSYAFVMWIDGKMSFEPASLEKDLLKYYKGLCAAVAGGKKLDLDLSRISVKVTKQDKKGKLGGEDAELLQARIDWYDPFVTGKPMTLHLELWGRPADAQKRSCLFAIASPLEKSAPVWEALRKIQAGFTCPK
ncbi:MAG: hypothetical protein HY293_14700 [Planctomycetes bacterium]|nr:hypothetical protein [Planctomycetota bacterium]